jgi:hypothetical protein
LFSILIKSYNRFIFSYCKISFLLDYFIPGGLVAELGVGARSPLCFVGKPLDFGIAELVGGGTLPVLLF